MGRGVGNSVGAVYLVYESIRGMLTRKIAAAPQGPLAIFAMTSEHAKLGWASVTDFGALISANLAVLNLLPIPPLDGFLLLVLLWEAIIQRRISPRAEMVMRLAGFFLLIMAFVAITYNDLLNLVRYGTP